MNLLENRVAVITGSTRGLGFSIAQTYAKEGASVIITGRSTAGVEAAVNTLRAQGLPADGIACDVSNREQVETLGAFAIEKHGKLDIWVNNAGLSAPYGPTADVPTSAFMNVVNTNIVGTYNGSMVALHYMLPKHSGKLINLLGRGYKDKKGVTYQNAYSSSKIWVRNFTLGLANEYKNSGISILAFSPGLVDTDMLRRPDAVRGFEQRLKPLETVIRLWGQPAHVPAEKALWLASSATDGKTGVVSEVLDKSHLMNGLWQEVIRRVKRQPMPDTAIQVHTVTAE